MPQLNAAIKAHIDVDANVAKYLVDDFMALMSALCKPQHLQPSKAISETVLQQLSNECQRLAFMTDVSVWKSAENFYLLAAANFAFPNVFAKHKRHAKLQI